MHIPFILRNFTEDDNNFIYHSFLKSFHTYYPQKYIPDILYFKPQAAIIDFLLKTSQCLVACFPEDPSEIIGYCIFQEQSDAFVVHYLYVKNQHRGHYIATEILKQINNKELIIATHICDDYITMKYKVPGCKVIYDPFLITKLREINDKM